LFIHLKKNGWVKELDYNLCSSIGSIINKKKKKTCYLVGTYLVGTIMLFTN